MRPCDAWKAHHTVLFRRSEFYCNISREFFFSENAPRSYTDSTAWPDVNECQKLFRVISGHAHSKCILKNSKFSFLNFRTIFHASSRLSGRFNLVLSPYRPSAFDHSVKKNMPGKLFLVFAKIWVPLVCKYVLCTKWNCNISLICIRVQLTA